MIRRACAVVVGALVALSPFDLAADTARTVAGTPAEETAPVWAAEIDAALASNQADAEIVIATADELRRTREEATAHEASFDLPSALRALHRACTASWPAGDDARAWLEWEAACDDAIRIAWGTQDDAALQQSLATLLRARPGRELTVGRFADGARLQAESLARQQQTGTLLVAGRGQGVWVDGEARGLAPLLVTGLPLGAHRLSCGAHTIDALVTPGDAAVITCAPDARIRGAGELGTQLAPGQAAVVLAADDAEWMIPGTWVFWSDEHVTGLRVESVERVEAGLDQVRTLRVR